MGKGGMVSGNGGTVSSSSGTAGGKCNEAVSGKGGTVRVTSRRCPSQHRLTLIAEAEDNATLTSIGHALRLVGENWITETYVGELSNMKLVGKDTSHM